MLSGTRASIAIKIFGDDLAALRASAEQVEARDAGRRRRGRPRDRAAGRHPAARDRRSTATRRALRPARRRARRDRSRPRSPGTKVTQVLEGQRTYDLVVRYRDDQRADVEAIAQHRRSTRRRAPRCRSSMLATIRDDVGPNTIIARERAAEDRGHRPTSSGRDLAQRRSTTSGRGIERDVKLPEGYYVVYGGQFESEQRGDAARIALLGAGRGRRHLPAAVPRVPLGAQRAPDHGQPAARADRRRRRGVRSAAACSASRSLVGFITLFGIATRNGIMMVSHYEHLRAVEGATLRRGGRARLARAAVARS